MEAVNVSYETINIVTDICYNSEALSTHRKQSCIFVFGRF